MAKLHFFNTTGPCNPDRHYVSVERCDRVTEIERAMPTIYATIQKHAREYSLPVPYVQTDNVASLLNSAVPDCYPIIFDRRPEAQKQPWNERLSWSAEDDVT